MKRITVTVPDEVYQAARLRAAKEGRSLSRMVAAYLCSLADADPGADAGAAFARLEDQQRRIQEQIGRFRAIDRLPRAEVHDRTVL